LSARSLLCRVSCSSVISCLWALMNGALIRDEDMDDVIGMILPDVRYPVALFPSSAIVPMSDCLYIGRLAYLLTSPMILHSLFSRAWRTTAPRRVWSAAVLLRHC
jgi:hypothetical protein